jgi:hypothetical protein
MRSTNVPLRIIDDLHNLMSGTRNKQRRLLNLLRWLADELQILSGGGRGPSRQCTPFRADDQLAGEEIPANF